METEKITFEKISLENLRVFGFPVQLFENQEEFSTRIKTIQERLTNSPVDREKKDVLKLILGAMPINKGSRGVWANKFKSLLQKSEKTISNVTNGIKEVDLQTLNRIASENCYDKEKLKDYLLSLGKNIRLSDYEPYKSDKIYNIDIPALIGNDTEKLEYATVQRNISTFGCKTVYEYLYKYLGLPNKGTTNYDDVKETVEAIEISRSNSNPAEVNKKNARDAIYYNVLKDENKFKKYNNYLIYIQAEQYFNIIQIGERLLSQDIQSRKELFKISCDDAGLDVDTAEMFFDYFAVVIKQVLVYDGLLSSKGGGSAKSKAELELQGKLAQRKSKLNETEAKRMEKEAVLKEAEAKTKEAQLSQTKLLVRNQVADALAKNNYMLASELAMAHPGDIGEDLENQILTAIQMMERVAEIAYDPTIPLNVRQKAIVCGVEDFGADPNNLITSVLGTIKIKPCFSLRVQNVNQGTYVTVSFSKEDPEYIPDSLRHTYKLKVIRTFGKPALDVFEQGFVLTATPELDNQFLDSEAIGEQEVFYTAFCSRLGVWSSGVSTSIKLHPSINPDLVEQRINGDILVLSCLLPINCKHAYLKFEEVGYNTKIESVVLNFGGQKYWSYYETRQVGAKKTGFAVFELPIKTLKKSQISSVNITCVYLPKDNKRGQASESKAVEYEITGYATLLKKDKSKRRNKLFIFLGVLVVIALAVLIGGYFLGAFDSIFKK
jgi:hypothetical protein